MTDSPTDDGRACCAHPESRHISGNPSSLPHCVDCREPGTGYLHTYRPPKPAWITREQIVKRWESRVPCTFPMDSESGICGCLPGDTSAHIPADDAGSCRHPYEHNPHAFEEFKRRTAERLAEPTTCRRTGEEWHEWDCVHGPGTGERPCALFSTEKQPCTLAHVSVADVLEAQRYRTALEEIEPILKCFQQTTAGWNSFDEAYHLAVRGLTIAKRALGRQK